MLESINLSGQEEYWINPKKLQGPRSKGSFTNTFWHGAPTVVGVTRFSFGEVAEVWRSISSYMERASFWPLRLNIQINLIENH